MRIFPSVRRLQVTSNDVRAKKARCWSNGPFIGMRSVANHRPNSIATGSYHWARIKSLLVGCHVIDCAVNSICQASFISIERSRVDDVDTSNFAVLIESYNGGGWCTQTPLVAPRKAKQEATWGGAVVHRLSSRFLMQPVGSD